MSIIDPALLNVEVIYSATGTTQRPGGQHAGTPPMEVRVTHLPTGLVAQCGAARSQHINKMVATEMIEAALTGRYADRIA